MSKTGRPKYLVILIKFKLFMYYIPHEISCTISLTLVTMHQINISTCTKSYACQVVLA